MDEMMLARRKCLALALKKGMYDDSEAKLRAFLGERHSTLDRVKLLCKECGGSSSYHGGNSICRDVPDDVIEAAFPGKTKYEISVNCYQRGAIIKCGAEKAEFTWGDIANEMAVYFASNDDASVPTKPEEAPLATAENHSPSDRLREIEMEIRLHVRSAADHLLDVGRCLIEAKEAHLVPHGQWESWLEHNAGMSVRTAQRVMAAARAVPASSPLIKLDFSKVQALLALPEGEREAFAEKNDAESMSVRELQKAIQEKQALEKRTSELEGIRDQLREELKDARRKKADADMGHENEKIIRMQERNRLMNEIAVLKEAHAPSTGLSQEAKERIAELEREIAEQEEELERQAKLRAEAQAELLRARSQAARGEPESASGDTFTADELGAAARAFISKAAVLPHLGTRLAAMPQSQKAAYRQYVDMIADWCDSARAALDMVEGGVIDG